ncbi:hypothetical protein IWZ01DRAFT_524062 [Phyllosticta capitalensis]
MPPRVRSNSSNLLQRSRSSAGRFIDKLCRNTPSSRNRRSASTLEDLMGPRSNDAPQQGARETDEARARREAREEAAAVAEEVQAGEATQWQEEACLIQRALAMRPYLSPPHVDSARFETFVVLRDRLVECRRRITSYQTKLRVFNVMHQRLHMSSYQRTWLVEDVEKLIWRYVREVNLITYQNDKFMRDMGAIAYREGYNSQEEEAAYRLYRSARETIPHFSAAAYRCFLSERYHKRSNISVAHIISPAFGDNSARYLFGPTDDPAGHIWSLDNGIPMHRDLKTLWDMGGFTFVPYGRGLKVVLTRNIDQHMYSQVAVGTSTLTYQQLHNRQLNNWKPRVYQWPYLYFHMVMACFRRSRNGEWSRLQVWSDPVNWELTGNATSEFRWPGAGFGRGYLRRSAMMAITKRMVGTGARLFFWNPAFWKDWSHGSNEQDEIAADDAYLALYAYERQLEIVNG